MSFRYKPWRKFRLGNQHRYHHLNQLRLMEYGAEYFPALELAIASAKTSIYLEVYIFANDSIGERISQALCTAAKRGVDVRVIVDWVGSRAMQFGSTWDKAGVRYRFYNPKWFGPFGFSRTHRKIVVIDHNKAFVGGINICDDWKTTSGQTLLNPRWDFAAELNHEMAQEVEAAFLWQWQRTKEVEITPKGLKENIQDRIEAFQTLQAFDSSWPESQNGSSRSPLGYVKNSIGSFIARDNLHHRRTIEKAYLKAIGRATDEIYLVNPYFLPGHRLRTALTSAAKRGVRVHLLIGRGEFKWLDAAVTALYGALLKSGIRIHEYIADQMHAKLLVTDGQWFTLGSSNCDPLSFLVNHEANIMIADPTHAQWLIKRIQDAIVLRGRAIVMDGYVKRPWPLKIVQWLVYMMSRLMTRLYVFGNRS